MESILTLPWDGTKLTLVGITMLDTELTIYKGNICTPLNDECNDFIWGNFINESVVDSLHEFWHSQDILNFHDGMVLRQGDVTVDKDYKDSTDLHVPTELSCAPVRNYLDALQDVLNQYLKRFPMAETSRFQVKEPLSMQWYPKGGGFKLWHTERSNALPGSVYRHLVFMTYLNDVPDGGTEWYHQDKYVPAQKGYTVIWPADWTHHHRGRVSHTTEKAIITGWFSYI